MANRRPIKRLTEGKNKAKVLTPAELKKLLHALALTRNPKRNRLIVWLLFGAGLRITEVACIRIQDVLWPSGNLVTDMRIPAKYCKGNKAGHVFFYARQLQQALEAYLTVRIQKKLRTTNSPEYRGLDPFSPLILSENRQGYSLKLKKRRDKHGEIREYWAADTLQELVTNWGKKFGITGFSSHSGRRTLATRLSRKGVSEEMLQTLLRHEDPDTIYDYVDLDTKFVRDVLERMYKQSNE